MTDTLKSIINTLGENDGIVVRLYLGGISRTIDGVKEDCLSVAINLEDGILITFWQDEDDTYTSTDNFNSLDVHTQNAIFNQVMTEYGTEFVR